MIRVLVADKLDPAGLDKLRSTPEVEVEVRTGLSPEELTQTLREFDGVIIRSAVKLTRDCFANPGRLRAVARAGVGVDNVDLDAATAAGVLVLNTPDANTISTAEHTIGLLFALMRRIPDAHAHVRSGQWKRSDFVGKQLAGKTLAVIGLGRVGRAVAKRALACEMRVIAYDPLIGAATALDGAVKLLDNFDDVLESADCLTLHAKVTDETRGMIGPDQLAKLKPSAVIVNCARGELIDEQALADALAADRLAGAAVDVYSREPPIGNPLLSAKNVVLTPHLGASTAEAQVAVAVEAVDALLEYLLRGEIRSAVNVFGMPAHLSERDRGYLDLCSRMGTLLSSCCAGGIKKLCLTTRGEALRSLSETLARQCIIALLSPNIDTRVNLVNAITVARDCGIEVDYVAHGATEHYAEHVSLTIQTRDGEHQTEGTVFADNRPRILAINGYPMEIVPEGHLVLIFNDDKPGVIGLVGTVFGDHEINIADMTLSRRDRTALMLLKIDQQPGDELLKPLRDAEHILSVRTVALPPLSQPSD